MAYIVRITYKGGDTEIVPLWSAAYLEEVYSLEEHNKSLEYIEVINKEPTEEECEYFDSKVKKTKYVLPKEFKENRRIINEE